MTEETPVVLPEGYIEFYKDLETWQNREVLRIKQHFHPEKLDLIKLVVGNKRPLLEQTNPKLDHFLFRQSLSSFLNFLGNRRPDFAEPVQSMIRGLELLDFEKLITRAGKIDFNCAREYSERLSLNPGLLVFVLDHTLQPYLRVISEPYRSELVEERFFWEFPNICPVCGAKSSFSRLQPNDGQRFMFCDDCFSEWKVRYLACVHCGHDRPGDISILQVADDSYYRVYVCEKCKGYLKTYDQRSTGVPVDLFIANKETVYLDILARNQGFSAHDE